MKWPDLFPDIENPIEIVWEMMAKKNEYIDNTKYSILVELK